MLFPLIFLPVLQLLSPSIPLLKKYWAGHHFSISEILLETVYRKLALKPMWHGLCAMLCHSVVSNWDLSLAKTHGAWFQDLMMLRLLMSHCKEKFSERHSNR